MKYIIISCGFFFLFSIFIGFYVFNIKNFSIFLIIGESILDFFNSINNLLPFVITIPLFILLYYKKLRLSSIYKLSDLKIRNHILLIDDGKQKKFKALTILQIQNIPKHIVVKEERTRKKKIEKLMIPGNFQYLHYHLTSLARIIPNLCFEIRVLKNDIKIRFILSLNGNEINELINKIDTLKDIVMTVFQTTFSGLKLEILHGSQLKDAWGDIFGGWGSYQYKFIGDGKVSIDKIVEKTFLSILKIEDIPIFKIVNKKSQIDSLIRGLIGAHFELNYIISARPLELYDFEKQIRLLEDNAEKIKPDIRSKKFSQARVVWSSFSLKNEIQVENIREDLMTIRHAEITGMWEVSGYIVLRSNDKDKLNQDIQKIKALTSTIFGIKLNILKSSIFKRCFSGIPMRSQLLSPMNITSEQLAIFIHLPESPVPSLSRLDIPEFEVPPERRIREGISLGKILFYDQEIYPFQLTVEDLRLNTFICGLIGMGKTRLAMNILKQLTKKYPDINWLCLDWKGEYQYLKSELKSQEVLIYVPGSDYAPVELNMFDPQRSNTDEHARKLFAIIREVFKNEFNRQSELSAQMESVCKEVIRRVVKNPKMRNLNSFISELKSYAKEKQTSNRTILMTVSALINRFDKFRHGVLKRVFDVKKSNIDFDILMEKKVVFNLNYLLTKGGAKEDVRFLMNLILKYVIDKALVRGITDTLKHLVVIEDSQLLIPSVLREVPETSLVEDIPLLLRGVGESLITIATRPEVSSDIIANSGVKISFKSPYDSQKVARYQSLSDNQEDYLKTLPKREAIVTLPNFQFPFRIFTDYFDYQKEEMDFDIIDNTVASNSKLLPINPEQNKRFQGINEMGEKKVIKRRIHKQETNNNLDPLILFSKIQKILKKGPKNKKSLSEQLGIPKSELDEVLESFLYKQLILSRIAPIFNSKTKQKLYFLPEDVDWVENEIKAKIEKDFLKSGKIGKLAEEDNFDYIWYGNNTFIKIVPYKDNVLNLEKISKMIFSWFEEAIERESFVLIVIIPFYDWSEKIRTWLKSFNSNQILIFSYNIQDWEKLRNFLYNGINPEWNSDINKEQEDFKENKVGETSLESLTDISKEVYTVRPKLDVTLISNSNKKKILKNSKTKIHSEQNIQKKWINGIQKKYRNRFSLKFLEKFGSTYPSTEELAEELGCIVQNVDNALKGIKKYLKSVEIHDLYDPINYRLRHYGWKNENLGQNLMFLEINKILNEKSIEFRLKNFDKNMKVFIVKGKFLFYPIYREEDLNRFIEIFKTESRFGKFVAITLIIHQIELKNKAEKIIQKEQFKEKIKLCLFDWAELGPLIRRIMDNKVII